MTVDDPGSELTLCRLCGAAFVVPVRWAELDSGWAMELRCGECGDRRDVRLSSCEAERFGQALDLGVADLALMADALRAEDGLQLLTMSARRTLDSPTEGDAS